MCTLVSTPQQLQHKHTAMLILMHPCARTATACRWDNDDDDVISNSNDNDDTSSVVSELTVASGTSGRSSSRGGNSGVLLPSSLLTSSNSGGNSISSSGYLAQDGYINRGGASLSPLEERPPPMSCDDELSADELESMRGSVRGSVRGANVSSGVVLDAQRLQSLQAYDVESQSQHSSSSRGAPPWPRSPAQQQQSARRSSAGSSSRVVDYNPF
jgi:hypothetical protein